MKKNTDRADRKPKTVQFTIRNVPAHVANALRKKAVQDCTSLNQTLVDTLCRRTNADEEEPVYNDLDDIAGTWVEDTLFDQAIEEQDQIDEGLWR